MISDKNTKVKVTDLNEPDMKLMAQSFYDLIKNK